MANCRVVRIHRFGGPEVLQIDQVSMPQPQDDEVVIRVHAASVNPVDYKIRQGGYPMVKEDKLPYALGRDASGEVETCGTRAHTLKKGDPVYAFLAPDRGGYTDFLLVKATEMTARPKTLDHVQAAAVPLAAMTAWQGLFDHGGLQPAQRVLIHGAAGGVGHFAVQLAKAKGAHVITTVSGQDIDFVRGLGADEAIDYKTQRFEELARDIDVVFDLIAGETQERSWSVLKRGGALISTLQKPDESKARDLGVRAANYMARPNPAQLQQVGDLIDSGKVRIHIDSVFPLDQVQAAHRRLEHEHVRGKIVLQVS